jgi:hypothetical protein
VYAQQVVNLPEPAPVFANCSLTVKGTGNVSGSVTVTGYIDTPGGRLYRIGDPVTTPGAWFKVG